MRAGLDCVTEGPAGVARGLAGRPVSAEGAACPKTTIWKKGVVKLRRSAARTPGWSGIGLLPIVELLGVRHIFEFRTSIGGQQYAGRTRLRSNHDLYLRVGREDVGKLEINLIQTGKAGRDSGIINVRLRAGYAFSRICISEA